MEDDIHSGSKGTAHYHLFKAKERHFPRWLSITTAVLSGYYPGLRGIEKDGWIPLQIDGEAIRKGRLERYEDDGYDLDEVALPEIPSDSYYKYL